MTANGLYLLTALLLHLTLLTTGLHRAKHFELIQLLFLTHMTVIVSCIITVMVSLFCEIMASSSINEIVICSFKIDIKIFPRILLIITLILAISRLFKSWEYTYQYFRILQIKKHKHI